jgi:2-oxo-hept-3-ene-1,7-dioate hydratase
MPDPDASDAVGRGMRAQLARRDVELADGARQVGWKIGFNTPAIQQAFGLSDPVVGYLLDRGVTTDGATVSLDGWTAPAVEVEVAVRVGDDGGVAGLAPALELVDLDISFDDIEPVLANNICQRGVVFGDEVPGVDPWAVVANVTRDRAVRDGGGADSGQLVAEGGRISEDPATTVDFVRSFLAAHGSSLEPGHRIIAGSVVPPIPVAPGDSLDVDFGPLGRLSVRFAR